MYHCSLSQPARSRSAQPDQGSRRSASPLPTSRTVDPVRRTAEISGTTSQGLKTYYDTVSTGKYPMLSTDAALLYQRSLPTDYSYGPSGSNRRRSTSSSTGSRWRTNLREVPPEKLLARRQETTATEHSGPRNSSFARGSSSSNLSMMASSSTNSTLLTSGANSTQEPEEGKSDYRSSGGMGTSVLGDYQKQGLPSPSGLYSRPSSPTIGYGQAPSSNSAYVPESRRHTRS